jgi:conjugal transfer pilus assembly protein TraE
MKFDLFVQRTSNLWAENRLLKFVVVALAVGYAVNVYLVINLQHDNRTILVPPVINSQIEISGDRASDSYIKEMTRSIAGLAFSYSPATARNQFSELLAMYHPAEFQAARLKLFALADKIETTRASSVFYIHRITNDHAKKQIEVEGARRTYQNDQMTENGVKMFVISYRMLNGRFFVTGLEEKERSAPAEPSIEPVDTVTNSAQTRQTGIPAGGSPGAR